jgi:hypothetical protein
MLGITKSRLGRDTLTAARRPARLGCEQLPDRINPAHVTFSSSSFPITGGQFDYDDTLLDATLSSQTVPFSNFGFIIDTTDPNTGQIIHNQYTADTTPEAEFEYGAFHSVHIEASTSDPTMPHFGIDLDHGITDTATVYNSFTGTTSTYNVILVLPQKQLVIDFASMTTGKAYQIKVVSWNKTTPTRLLDVQVGQAATAEDIASAVAADLQGAGYSVTQDGTKLTIKAQNNTNFTQLHLTAFNIDPVTKQPVTDNTIKGPTFVSANGGVKLYYNSDKDPVQP